MRYEKALEIVVEHTKDEENKVEDLKSVYSWQLAMSLREWETKDVALAIQEGKLYDLSKEGNLKILIEEDDLYEEDDLRQTCKDYWN